MARKRDDEKMLNLWLPRALKDRFAKECKKRGLGISNVGKAFVVAFMAKRVNVVDGKLVIK